MSGSWSAPAEDRYLGTADGKSHEQAQFAHLWIYLGGFSLGGDWETIPCRSNSFATSAGRRWSPVPRGRTLTRSGSQIEKPPSTRA